ncbi:hypothetical protein [Corynebacterium mastitidis]|uniref:hypothetical protein n=1 Tax=Corynebacterium mastitidis TaxID=161890 RepID=UPI00254BB49E|nr:hypothetical protein [Corynebacterium mastitidis]MDK8450932.1 hypothetical protein [Corynebacterium mastitidis]
MSAAERRNGEPRALNAWDVEALGAEMSPEEAEAMGRVAHAVREQVPLSAVDMPSEISAAMAAEMFSTTPPAIMEYVHEGRIGVVMRDGRPRLRTSDVVVVRKEAAEEIERAVFELMDLELELEAQEAALGEALGE